MICSELLSSVSNPSTEESNDCLPQRTRLDNYVRHMKSNHRSLLECIAMYESIQQPTPMISTANELTYRRTRERTVSSGVSADSIPPRASPDAIANLPRARVLPLNRIHALVDDVCSVCCQPLSEGFLLSKLPCGHIYHTTCVVPWLQSTCTCPICRYELPTSDMGYEVQRKERMQSYPTVEQCNCTSLHHKCFFTLLSDHDKCVSIQSNQF
jgi:hypothetical protein